jgi:hypothetical protein
MVALVLVSVSAVGLVVVAFLAGRVSGRTLYLQQLIDEAPLRRQLLERLAKLEGVRITGRES